MRDAREAIVLVCRRLYERGLVAGPDGNVSVRRDDGTLLVTPTGLSKVDVTPDDLVVVSLQGRVREGRRAPSSELGMHLRIYQRRPDVRAVVHAHPPAATAFAVAGESFVAPVLPEVILQLGEVPLVPYATPGSDALADAFEPFLAQHDGFLMANHGATTIAPSLAAAHQRMESLEHAARILLAARGLGRVNELSAADVRSLRATREESR
ncbi:MAG TPA: class II aldolase/adducin family protein [Gemmatimonadaceae bacterium]|nr:class II aldolase/adducin family protein [Gemmatimonadaceae bacterium]